MISVLGLKRPKSLVGLAQHPHVGIACDPPACQPCGEGVDRLIALCQRQYFFEGLVEQARLARETHGEAQNYPLPAVLDRDRAAFRAHRFTRCRNHDLKVVLVHELASVPLQRIAQIDRHTQGAGTAVGSCREVGGNWLRRRKVPIATIEKEPTP